jgi:hypothetical protein
MVVLPLTLCRRAASGRFNFTRAMLLYVGDILAAYGVLLFFGAWAVRWRGRWLLVLLACFFPLIALPSDAMPPDLSAMFSSRIVVQPFIMLLSPTGFACPFLIGLVTGRMRILERPERYRRLLKSATSSAWHTATEDAASAA